MQKKDDNLTPKQRYRKKLVRLTIDFYPTEKDLVEQLNSQEKKQTYIKDLIRKDIERQRIIKWLESGANTEQREGERK